MAFLLATKSTNKSVNQISVIFTQHRARARLALQWFWPALGSPCSPASCGYLLSGQGSGEIEGSLFTGQAQIRFLTAPPERLCQGKLALQNCSLTGKCVSLFISHSHWKKGGVGEWLVMMSFFPRNFSKASRFTATLGTASVLPHRTGRERGVSLPSPITLPPPPPLSGCVTWAKLLPHSFFFFSCACEHRCV